MMEAIGVQVNKKKLNNAENSESAEQYVHVESLEEEKEKENEESYSKGRAKRQRRNVNL